MNHLKLACHGNVATIILEAESVYGMDYMTDIFVGDVEKVSGVTPCVETSMENAAESAILVATCGASQYLDAMEAAGDINLTEVRGKREVYGLFFVQSERTMDKPTLVIAGSDKRGTIYGMFRVSEEMGVSPWVYWADAVPKKREEITIEKEFLHISKEPSVRYRGFFINDEQPCFGNWAKEKFGSAKPSPELYHHIFELMLRLKGNYIWPAMWRSDFSMDHIENAEIAHRMGVIVGASHHEPCCRSGGEFQTLIKETDKYGKEWSFLSNAEGISEFWKDGLIRNHDFESLITIGMRGEFDSYLMPEDATLEDNINVLKSAITEQKRLIAEYGNQEHPQLLAIYKEVEDYYQGDENTEGLKDWDVLKDDIMMLCDDNFSNLRTLPNEEQRQHPRGYGMYYHFDYYGGPVSYLWINSTPLTKIWEQMSMAYDYGVQDAWIVNVGDIKNQELSLSYFLDLAYDFEKWGTNAPNKTTEYTKLWLQKQGFTDACYDGLEHCVEEYVRWNGTCRPEVLKPMTYHPAHFGEAQRMLERVDATTEQVQKLWEQLTNEKEADLKDCFFELVYYPVMASANIIRMQIFAGMNQYYVKQRKKQGNDYAPPVEACIAKDRELVEAYHTLHEGKWNHMQSVFHIGFIGWNDEEWQYPDTHTYHPVCAPRLMGNVKDAEPYTGANPWRRKTLTIALSNPMELTKEVELYNAGEGTLDYRLVWEADWLEIEPAEGISYSVEGDKTIAGTFEDGVEVTIRCNPEKIADAKMGELYTTKVCVYGDNCEETAERSENEYSETRLDIEVTVELCDLTDVKAGSFVENQGIVAIEAPNYAEETACKGASWKTLDGFGKTVGGVKVFPTTAQFSLEEEAPVVAYDVYVKEAGNYELQLYTAPSNPVIYQGRMDVAVRVNEEAYQAMNTIPEKGYVPWLSHDWSVGVLEQIHKSKHTIALQKGNNVIALKGMDPAVVLEKLVLVREGVTCPSSYLGPVESYRK